MPSFDVASEANMQEVKNAVDQVQRELATRYDFKDSKSSIELKEAELLILIVADDNLKLSALQDMLRQRLAKRNVSQKLLEFKPEIKAGGDLLRQEIVIKKGLADTDLKRLNKMIKDTGLKISSSIQGAQLRVTGKKRDDLQAAIAHLKKSATDLELQFVNFRE